LPSSTSAPDRRPLSKSYRCGEGRWRRVPRIAYCLFFAAVPGRCRPSRHRRHPLLRQHVIHFDPADADKRLVLQRFGGAVRRSLPCSRRPIAPLCRRPVPGVPDGSFSMSGPLVRIRLPPSGESVTNSLRSEAVPTSTQPRNPAPWRRKNDSAQNGDGWDRISLRATAVKPKIALNRPGHPGNVGSARPY
jgi:hypothetical protein